MATVVDAEVHALAGTGVVFSDYTMSDEAREVIDKKEKIDSEPAAVVAEGEAADSKRKADAGLEPEKKKKKKKSRHSKYDELDEPKTDSDDDDDEDDEKDVDDDKLVVEDEEEDDLAEIDASNIITQGRRTRGKVIDYTKVEAELKKQKETSEKAGDEIEDEDDEDEDDDFKEPEEKK